LKNENLTHKGERKFVQDEHEEAATGSNAGW
jgi:hypothetical protein